jgi:hypothetical protein
VSTPVPAVPPAATPDILRAMPPGEGEAKPERWNPIADDVFSPAAAASGDRGVTVFMRSAKGELLWRERQGDAFGELRSLGVPEARVEGSGTAIPVDWPISACSTRDGVIHLLARGAEGDLVHGRLRGGDWSGFESIGIPIADDRGNALPMGLAGAPVACCRERGQLDIFAVSGEGDLLQAGYDASGFSACVSLGSIFRPDGQPSPVFGAIAAFDAGTRTMGVVARGPSDDVVVKLWTRQEWTPFERPRLAPDADPLDPALQWTAPLTGPIAACGGGSARADLFARGPHGEVLHRSWNGETWTMFQLLGMPLGAKGERIAFTAGPIACAWGRFRLDVFACAVDGRLYHAQCAGDWNVGK